MSMRQEENDIYIIPPNFIDTGTVFGGTIKLRNAAEALALSLLIGLPVFHLPVTLTAKIIIACLTVLPAALFAIIGINGESLSSFAISFFAYLKNRRVVGLQKDAEDPTEKGDISSRKRQKGKRVKADKKVKPKKEDFAEEFGQFRERRQAKQAASAEHPPARKRGASQVRERVKENPEPELLNPAAAYLPIQKIKNGIIYTKDHRYVKAVEVIPINFLLRSAREQRSIIYSFISYLKISPVKLQFKVLTKRADINRHLEALKAEMRQETDERCLALQKDYESLIRRIGSKEAITRRFFLIFEYEALSASRGNEEADAVSALATAVRTAKTYLQQCGNEILVPDNEDEMATEVFYSILNRKTSVAKPLSVRVNEVIGQYINAGRRDEIDRIPAMEFIAPESIDYTHGNFVVMDGTYHTYLLVPSGGYRTQVCAGWLSLLVNAGEGIDVDIFFDRQPKDRIQQKLGQQLRINRSKIKDTSDTNSDFDDLDSAIRSGYFLKEGLAGNEDFYYMNILITITADSLEELEWRTNEMKKLMLSQDMEAVSCHFREEQALLSALPLVSLDRKLFDRSRRNILTASVASCYPFTSFEMCDDNGILLGVNKHNNSLIIVDIFNSHVYKNANMAILGTSGAGKTFTMQLMALRMRRRNIQVFIIAPLKGHEFHRACSNIGGEFIQISPASRNCINIMEIRKVDSSANDLLDGPQTEKSELAAKIQRLHIFFSLLIPDMTHEERQLLDEALIQAYSQKGITHSNESLPDPDCPGHYREMPVLEDVFNILKKNADTRRLANIMNRLVHGSASTFNQQTNVNLDNKYTVLDISELTGDLLTVGMFVALDYVWDKAKEDRTVEKAIFIDETWQLIGAASNRLAAEFVLEIFKIIRGYGGSAICAGRRKTRTAQPVTLDRLLYEIQRHLATLAGIIQHQHQLVVVVEVHGIEKRVHQKGAVPFVGDVSVPEPLQKVDHLIPLQRRLRYELLGDPLLNLAALCLQLHEARLRAGRYDPGLNRCEHILDRLLVFLLACFKRSEGALILLTLLKLHAPIRDLAHEVVGVYQIDKLVNYQLLDPLLLSPLLLALMHPAAVTCVIVIHPAAPSGASVSRHRLPTMTAEQLRGEQKAGGSVCCRCPVVLLHHALTPIEQLPIHYGRDPVLHPYVAELIHADIFLILEDPAQTVFIE